MVNIPKKSSVRTLNNHRSVDLTSLMMKAMEKGIKMHIIKVIDPLHFPHWAGGGVDDEKYTS